MACKASRPALAVSLSGAGILATSYFRATYRSTIIGAAAFHFRVRNGNGWFHCARVTRGPAIILLLQILLLHKADHKQSLTGDSGYHLGLPSREPTSLNI